LKSVILPDSVTAIANRAFDGCAALTSVTIPNSATDVHAEAFRDCDKLVAIFAEAQLMDCLAAKDTLRAAVGYLIKPDGHSEESAAAYTEHCKSHAEELLELIIDTDSVSAMEGYAKRIGISAESRDSVLEAAKQNGADRVMAFLRNCKELSAAFS
jgi:hypothetical protein